ncbi:MAG: hypothetical protein WEA61_07950 [Anaerolineales bacterium]
MLLKIPLAQAGAGMAAWAGLVDYDLKQYRPVYFALQQLIDKLGRYESITRIPFDDDGIRLYEFEDDGQKSWIAWYDPATVYLPGDNPPQATLQFDFGTASVVVQDLTINEGGSQSQTIQAANGPVSILLGPSPVYITAGN